MRWFPRFNLFAKKKIRIIGYGVLGKAVGHSISTHYHMEAIDLHHSKVHALFSNKKPDAVIICVDAPTHSSGTVDTTNLQSVLGDIKDELGNIPIMVKTTLTPDLMALLPDNAVYCPEFLRQNNAREDFKSQPFMLVGGSEANCLYWKNIFKYLGTEHIATTPEAASWVKYIHNSFLATKVAFFHDMDRGAELNDDKVNLYAALDIISEHSTQIGSSHMYAPSSDGNYGYAGACFPKDMASFQKYTQSELLDKIIKHNAELRTNRPNE